MRFQSIRGVKDILPDESYVWQNINNQARKVFALYNYAEAIIPLIEDCSLFKRSLGQDSEVVEKQMFLIERKDNTLALRPEGTAGIVRAYLENGLDKKSPFIKLFYIGPMFRAERPQKGRLRQFNHIGAEVLGSFNPFIDVEIITLCSNILAAVGISDFKIKLNTLGSLEEKKEFANALREILQPKLGSFCEDCKARFERNVFRLLDCKNESCRNIINSCDLSAKDYLSNESIEHFEKVKKNLDSLKIDYVHDKFLVRGLDYYTGTVFEITHPNLGAQDAIGAGGRYDSLVKDLGGPEIGAIGFALGIERLMLAIERKDIESKMPKLSLYIAAMGNEAIEKALILAKDLRKDGISVEIDYENRRLDKKISRASKMQAKFLAIIGEDELRKNIITIKDLSNSKQEEVKMEKESLRGKLC